MKTRSNSLSTTVYFINLPKASSFWSIHLVESFLTHVCYETKRMDLTFLKRRRGKGRASLYLSTRSLPIGGRLLGFMLY